MSKRDDNDLLQDIRECINRIQSYTENMSYDDFFDDYKTQDAVIRNIEIMGEAVKLLSETTKNKYCDVPWKSIAGTRDRLIHDYFGVNIDVVWSIINEDLPLLKEKILIK